MYLERSCRHGVKESCVLQDMHGAQKQSRGDVYVFPGDLSMFNNLRVGGSREDGRTGLRWRSLSYTALGGLGGRVKPGESRTAFGDRYAVMPCRGVPWRYMAIFDGDGQLDDVGQRR